MYAIVKLLIISALAALCWWSQPDDMALAGPVIPAVIMAAGTVMQGLSKYQEGRNQAAVSEYNAKVSEQAAAQEDKASKVRAAQHKRKGEAFQAGNVAAIGKSGVGFSGSPLVRLVEDAKQLEYDRQLILHAGDVAAQQLRSRAKGQRMQADSFRQQGTNALFGAGLSAAGGALSDLGTIKFRKSMMDYMGARSIT